MSDLKLFRIVGGEVSEETSHSEAIEKSLQQLVEQDLETLTIQSEQDLERAKPLILRSHKSN